MVGAVLIIIALLLAPILICMSFAGLAALLGEVLHRDGQARHEGSELLDVGV